MTQGCCDIGVVWFMLFCPCVLVVTTIPMALWCVPLAVVLVCCSFSCQHGKRLVRLQLIRILGQSLRDVWLSSGQWYQLQQEVFRHAINAGIATSSCQDSCTSEKTTGKLITREEYRKQRQDTESRKQKEDSHKHIMELEQLGKTVATRSQWRGSAADQSRKCI